MLFAFIAFLTMGCFPAVIKYPGTTAHLGKDSTPYLKRFDKRIGEEQQVKLKEKNASNTRIASHAVAFIGENVLMVNGEQYRYDCSGLVEASYSAGGFAITGITNTLYDLADKRKVLHKKKKPAPGDVAFFHDTYDKNKNGKKDDGITHVALVEKVDVDGTIHLIHLGGSGVTRIFMNLNQRGLHKVEHGKVWNSYIRYRTSKTDRSPRLSGELWVSFASLWQAPKDS
jgi:hypothetical protein